MIHNVALGVLATAAGTRITALLLLAGTIRGTVRVENTFRAASLVGITKVLGQTLTGASSIALNALSIGTTRRWLTGIDDLHITLNRLTLGERISG